MIEIFRAERKEKPKTGKTERNSDATFGRVTLRHIRRVDSLILAERKPRANIKYPFVICLLSTFFLFFIICQALVGFLLTIEADTWTELATNSDNKQIKPINVYVR